MCKVDLSIIVPVYNVEKYLKKCIESLIGLEIDNYEIILINDGSTDKSLEICETYSKKYPKLIKVINQKNKGLSESRNTGLKIAKGEYVYFIDSDDFIEKDKFEDCFKTLVNNNSDVLIFGYYFEDENNQYNETRYSYISAGDKLYESNDLLINELSNRNLPAAVCFGIYKKKLIVDNNLFFEPGILHEDERWSPQLLLLSKKIYLSSKVVYHYIQRNNSIMHKKDRTQNGIDLINTSIYLSSIVDLINDKKLKKYFKNRLTMLYLRGIYVGRLYRKNYKKYIDRLYPVKNARKLKDVLKSIIFMIHPYLYYIFACVIKGD